MTLKYFSGVGGLEKLILKLTSASTKVGDEARAEPDVEIVSEPGNLFPSRI